MSKLTTGITTFLLFVTAGNFIPLAAQASGASPPTVTQVDLGRYIGRWHELSRVPNSFQDKEKNGFGPCYNTVAEYAIRDDGNIDVTNTCARYNAAGVEKIDVAHAIARVVSGSQGAKLKVNFTGSAILRWLGIGDGDYWVFGLSGPGPAVNPGDSPLGDEVTPYRWALVGAPGLEYGWILSRGEILSDADEAEINHVRATLGYAPDAFKEMRR